MKRPASLVAAIVLILISLAQLSRVLFRVSVVAAGTEIPIWPSGIVALFLGSLALWLLKERKAS